MANKINNDAIENFKKMISKNSEKRFAKNYNFVFGNDYINNKEFKNAVNDFINKNEDVYNNIYQKVFNQVDIGTTPESMNAFSNMLDFISQKENMSMQDIQTKMLDLAGTQKDKLLDTFKVNKEAFEHLGLNSSVWTMSSSIQKSQKELLQESIERQRKIAENFKKKTGTNSKKTLSHEEIKAKSQEIKAKSQKINQKVKEQNRKSKNEYNQRRTRDIVKQSHIDELQNQINIIDSDISKLKSQNPNHPDIVKLQERRDGLYNNLRNAKNTRHNSFNSQKLELPAPREGAPMFEGLAVPSEYVDSNGNVIKSFDNINKESELKMQQSTSTSSSNIPDVSLDDSQPTGPQRGDQFYDPKRKRQYVYEGPDETFEGMHSFISDQGRTFVGSLDDLEKFTDESRFLNIDDLSEYRSAIDDLHTFLGDIRHGSKSMEDGFWDRAQKAVRRVNKAEGKVKKKIKYHRMENDAYKTKKVLQGYIDDWKKKHAQQSAPQPENTQKVNTPETDVPFEEEWFDGYDGADNAPFGAEDFDDKFLANLTDDQILNQARNNEELEHYIKMRDDARTRLGMDNQTFNIETENKTINNNFNGVKQQQQIINDTEETIEEKIKRLTEEERQRFERESQADFDKSMEEIEAEFNQEAERIEKEFGSAKYDLDDTSLHLDSPDVKARKQRLENAGKRLSSNKGPNGTKKRFTGQRVANNSKRSIKKRKLSGKKFKVKGGNLKQAAANTFVNIATETVRETIAKNADELKNFGRHPNMFEFDEFADLTDADIDFYYGNLFGMDIKTKQQMKKNWIEKRKLAKTARKSANKRKIIDNFDDYMDNFFSYNGYSSVEGQARFNPDPEVGWDEADFKNPDSYNRHRIDFEVDDDGNLKFKRYDEMDTIEIEQNKSRRIKSNIDDDDIFGWMKKHKIGLGEAINVLSTVSAYKDARKQGHSVGSSMVRAAGSFVMGEMLGFWGSMGWELAKGIPKAAIKGAEVLYKENRKMNAAANQHGLGGDFQDTQQLATMRQSGMEMAKMAQYNLQQTLMGNEASFLHR